MYVNRTFTIVPMYMLPQLTTTARSVVSSPWTFLLLASFQRYRRQLTLWRPERSISISARPLPGPRPGRDVLNEMIKNGRGGVGRGRYAEGSMPGHIACIGAYQLVTPKRLSTNWSKLIRLESMCHSFKHLKRTFPWCDLFDVDRTDKRFNLLKILLPVFFSISNRSKDS